MSHQIVRDRKSFPHSSLQTACFIATGYHLIVAPAFWCSEMMAMSNSWMVGIIHQYIGAHDAPSNTSLAIQFSFTRPLFVLQRPIQQQVQPLPIECVQGAMEARRSRGQGARRRANRRKARMTSGNCLLGI
jgi:hypothetical protein